MPNTFAPMTTAEQARFKDAYLAYLKQRDGVPDLATQRFDIRERFFAELDANPDVWDGPPPVDQAVFDRNHDRERPEPGLDEATLWALATAKVNRAEAFGVDYAVSAFRGRTRPDGVNPHDYIQVEEHYHTRILKDAVATLGVEMHVGQPGFSARALIKSMVHLPQEASGTLVFCGEIVGVALFSLLLGKARQLFGHQPAAMRRIEALFGQVMVDEVGHVHYARSLLGPKRIALAKQILPLVARGVVKDMHELVQLFGMDEILRCVKAADVDGAAAPYPDRFVYEAA
jgi:hypothetical protein